MKNAKPQVVIEFATKWSYYQWFLLGLYELKKQKKIDLQFKMPLECWLYTKGYLKKMGNILNIIHNDSYNLKGYVILPNNEKKKFCIDCADSPFLFNSKDLDEVNCYFKMQCPKEINKDYFEISESIHIPWLDHIHENEKEKYFVVGNRGKRRICNNFKVNRNKIKPLMIGPRSLGNGINYGILKKGYDNYINSQNIYKEKIAMCYFGNAKGPIPSKSIIDPDFDWESDFLGYFGKEISHPNEKRAKIGTIMNKLGKNYDVRIISLGNSDTMQYKNPNLVVPLKDFCSFISKFQYNVNISGYRLSIPNRFIESFMVGTAIFTDKLSIKWYLPFSEDEVVETEKMGYLKDEKINWKKIEKDLINLQKSNPQKIIESFNNKWKPVRVAEYILEEIGKS